MIGGEGSGMGRKEAKPNFVLPRVYWVQSGASGGRATLHIRVLFNFNF